MVHIRNVQLLFQDGEAWKSTQRENNDKLIIKDKNGGERLVSIQIRFCVWG